MKVVVNAVAEVTYNCWLDEEDSLKLTEYMEDNGISVEKAVEELYEQDEIDLYSDCEEVDFVHKNFITVKCSTNEEEDE